MIYQVECVYVLCANSCLSKVRRTTFNLWHFSEFVLSPQQVKYPRLVSMLKEHEHHWTPSSSFSHPNMHCSNISACTACKMRQLMWRAQSALACSNTHCMSAGESCNDCRTPTAMKYDLTCVGRLQVWFGIWCGLVWDDLVDNIIYLQMVGRYAQALEPSERLQSYCRIHNPFMAVPHRPPITHGSPCSISAQGIFAPIKPPKHTLCNALANAESLQWCKEDSWPPRETALKDALLVHSDTCGSSAADASRNQSKLFQVDQR